MWKHAWKLSIYITKTVFFYSYKHKKSIFDTTFTFQNFKVINCFYFLFSPNHERASCFTHWLMWISSKTLWKSAHWYYNANSCLSNCVIFGVFYYRSGDIIVFLWQAANKHVLIIGQKIKILIRSLFCGSQHTLAQFPNLELSLVIKLFTQWRLSLIFFSFFLKFYSFCEHQTRSVFGKLADWIYVNVSKPMNKQWVLDIAFN